MSDDSQRTDNTSPGEVASTKDGRMRTVAPDTASGTRPELPETGQGLRLLPGQVRLVVSRGEFKGKSFLIEDGENLIGRWDPDQGAFPEIDLDDEDPDAKVSRKHAVIHRSGNEIAIEDIGSLNGTFINQGPRLEPGRRVKLRDGDDVIVGKTFLKVLAAPEG